MFEHLDLFPTLFDYLTQPELINMLLTMNQLLYQQIMKYIPAKMPKIKCKRDLKIMAANNAIISIKLMKNTMKIDWNYGLKGACRAGNEQLMDWFAKKMRNDEIDWSDALNNACRGLHYKIIEKIKDKAYLPRGFYGACQGGSKKLAEQMIEKHENIGPIILQNFYEIALYYACKGGNLDIAEWLIEEKHAKSWGDGFAGACRGGHIAIAKWMLSNGASTHLSDGLLNACKGGHKHIAEWLIGLGADDWEYGLEGACMGGREDFAEWMIEKGAKDFERQLYIACQYGRKNMAKLMIAKGASNWNSALYGACERNQPHMMKFIIKRGATSCNCCCRLAADHLN